MIRSLDFIVNGISQRKLILELAAIRRVFDEQDLLDGIYIASQEIRQLKGLETNQLERVLSALRVYGYLGGTRTETIITEKGKEKLSKSTNRNPEFYQVIAQKVFNYSN